MTGYRKSKRIGLVLFAVALFLVSWESSSAETDEEYLARMHDEYEYIDEDTTWKKTDDLVFSKPILITNTAILTIESGATVHINGDTLTVNHGSIIAEGTESEPIVFKADGNRRFSISFQNTYINTVSRWRYVEIRGAGKFWQEPCVYQANNSSFFTPTVFAAEMCDNMVPVLTYLGGKLHIENTSFIDTQGMDISVRADFQYDESDPEWDSWEDFLNVINSNLADNQQGKALQSTVYCYGQEISSAQCNRRIYLKNNWYGEKIALNNDEAFFRHAQLHGDYVLEGWRAGSLIADPLLIVPGVMGSSQAINGQLVLDPILHTYDDLVASLERNGYEKGKNLFSFPYDWRQSNAYTAELLASRLSTIRTQTGLTKVDVVAHSMGGLVVRSYIEGNGYHDDIDQLITLGAPHHGSPEAYLRWEGGEGFLDRQSKIVRYHFSVEAKHAGYDDLQKYIQAKVLSVRDLLPDTNYLIDADTGRVRNYPTNYPRNTFLEDLNDSSSVAKLQAVRFTNVVGEVNDNKSTIARFRLEPTITSLLGKWVDGEPENFEDNSTDRGLEYGKGDTTVPTASATDITATDEQSLVAGHGDLPMQAQCLVFKKFTGKTDCDFVNDTAIPNILLFNVYSPVNVQIIAPDGKRMGANFDNPAEPFDEIPGAFYTRYHLDPNDTDPNTENEWVTIPNPQAGKYTVKTQGTWNGDFRVESVNISQGDTANEAEESTVNFIGTTTKDQEQSFALVLNDDKTVTGVAEDTIVPTTTPNITGTQGSNNWYTSDVTVTLTATDNENGSGVDTTQYSLNNGTTWNAYTQPIEVTQEGITKIQYRSIDKVKNTEETKTLEIKIDKTAPEAKFVFNLTTQRLDITGQDNLSPQTIVTMTDTLVSDKIEEEREARGFFDWFFRRKPAPKQEKLTTATITDEAGHTTKITFKKEKDQNRRIDITLRSIAYDGIVTNWKDTSLQYKWNIQKKTGKYMVLAAEAQTQNEQVESHYVLWRDMTYIMTRPEALDDDESDSHFEFRPTRQVVKGMKVLQLETKQGNVNIAY